MKLHKLEVSKPLTPEVHARGYAFSSLFHFLLIKGKFQ